MGREREGITRTIEVAVADGDGGEDEISDGFRLHPPHSETDDGQPVPATQ